MTRGQRSISALLTVVAVLLTANLFRQPAGAQPQVEIPPRVVSVIWGDYHSGPQFMMRAWSDGMVEWAAINVNNNIGCPFEDPCLTNWIVLSP